MRIIISPAKKMGVDVDTLPIRGLPPFLERTGRLLECLRGLDFPQLRQLLGCNEAIARLNYERYQSMDLGRNLTPAILAYDGIQYRYMAPQVFERSHFDYVQEHLRILSGFYGVLRPMDGVVPYRLEMGARLAVDGYRDLYRFWGEALAAEVCRGDKVVVDLASEEYAKAVRPHLPAGTRLIKCVFGALTEGGLVEKGVHVKMARGEMVRFLAETGAEGPEALARFRRLGYAFDEGRSEEDRLVFLKRGD